MSFVGAFFLTQRQKRPVTVIYPAKPIKNI